MANFEQIIGGINVIFPKDLEGVIGDSDKTKGLVATERPSLIETSGHSRTIRVYEESIPEGAVAYSGGIPTRYEDKIFISITYYRRRAKK